MSRLRIYNKGIKYIHWFYTVMYILNILWQSICHLCRLLAVCANFLPLQTFCHYRIISISDIAACSYINTKLFLPGYWSTKPPYPTPEYFVAERLIPYFAIPLTLGSKILRSLQSKHHPRNHPTGYSTDFVKVWFRLFVPLFSPNQFLLRRPKFFQHLRKFLFVKTNE